MMKKLAVYLAAFALALLVLSGCSNMFLEKPEERSGGGDSTGIPEGFGTVEVNLTRGAARTIMPEIELGSLSLEYRFTKDKDTAEETTTEETPVDGKFTLAPGEYSLEVKGYVMENNAPPLLVAQGTTDEDFTIKAGEPADTVNVSLHPLASGEGTGTLEYRLKYPADTTVETLTLTHIAGDEGPFYLVQGVTPSSTGLSGTKTGIPVGYYLLEVKVKNSGVFIGRMEVVHIYQNLTSRTGYDFIADDFSGVIRVSSNADAGTGTLRQAITDAMAATDPQVIQVILQPGTVIDLESPLQIIKSLTIEGNGVTLTRADTWTTSHTSSQLLRITDAAAEVQIRRLHFKNGLSIINGGAIYNQGTLTLESCIFSGNRTINSASFTGAAGGAINSENTLTIRGCTFYGNTADNYGGAVYFFASGKILTLMGNLFYGNTALSYPVVYRGSDTVNASYNVVDVNLGTGNAQTGWTAGTGDTVISALPVSPLSFKLLAGSGAGGKLPSDLSDLPDYPVKDFYGNTISGGGAAGAVQAGTENTNGYYYLELSVNNSLGGSVSVPAGLEPDDDGLYPADTTITASFKVGYNFWYWLVNGIKTDTETVSLSTHSFVQAVFTRTVTVTDFTDVAGSEDTPETLRYALTNAEDGDIISMSGGTAGTTVIELRSALPEITKRLTINGNGVTLTMEDSWVPSNTSQLLRITGTTAEVQISRVHFKNGLAATYGGAIYNTGILTLESCILSGNRITTNNATGGAINSANTLTLRGCTFYGNTADSAGAVYFYATGKTLTLTGNLFYGNTAPSYPVVRNNGGNVNASYNVVDVALGTGTAQVGWTGGTNNTVISDLPVSPLSFRLLYGRETKFPAADLPDYPVTDFYGATINTGIEWAAGAVQASTASGNYYLDYSVNNSLRGSVTVTPGPDTDGLYAASTSITASPESGYGFAYWLVNGVKDNANTTNTLSLSAHTWVEAVFHPEVTVFTDMLGSSETTAGTLRYALTHAADGDIITFSGVAAGTTEIQLESALPNITKSLTIEGSGVTLTPDVSWTANLSPLLWISNDEADVVIRRVHFTKGYSTNSGDGQSGGAIRNNAILTLESCIFSENNPTGPNGIYGAAIYSNNDLTIRGCTFYGNKADTEGGAVYFANNSGTLTLTGNLFYGNTCVTQHPVVHPGGNNTVITSYNVVDEGFGIGDPEVDPENDPKHVAGWDAGDGDTTFTALSISGVPFFDTTTFVPVSGLSGVLTTALANFPTTDFYGTTRTFPGAPGAVATAP
jgi:hypothetical protein